MNTNDFDLATIGELALACEARMDQLRTVKATPGHPFALEAAAASITVLKAAQAQLLASIAAPSRPMHLGGMRVVEHAAMPPGTALVRSGDQVVALGGISTTTPGAAE